MISLDLTARAGKTKLAVPCARFDDMSDLAAYLSGPVAAAPEGGTAHRHWCRPADTWTGASAAATLRHASTGDAARVALADAMLDRIEVSVGFEARRWRTLDSVAGGAPNVPAYLAGSPMSMRRRVRVMDTAAPLVIALELGVSASVDNDTIARRGAAALALARIASATRPVELWGYFAARDGSAHAAAMAVRLDTAPMDVARAAWLFCAPEALRRACFAVLAHVGGWTDDSVKWLPPDFDRHSVLAADLARQITGAADLVTVQGFLSNGERAFNTDAAAAAWVSTALATHGAVALAA